MNIVAITAAFVLIAAAIYLMLIVMISRMDARYERRSGETRRKDFG